MVAKLHKTADAAKLCGMSKITFLRTTKAAGIEPFKIRLYKNGRQIWYFSERQIEKFQKIGTRESVGLAPKNSTQCVG